MNSDGRAIGGKINPARQYLVETEVSGECTSGISPVIRLSTVRISETGLSIIIIDFWLETKALGVLDLGVLS